MPVKIRLARHGKKRKPYYHIVIADGRAPRDGRFIERIGEYNPNTNPATIEINFDKALNWLQKGAQPTETCRAILSYKGILFKNHLLGGVKKGAFSEEEAEKRFQAWLKEKENKIQAKKDGLAKASEDEIRKSLEIEAKVNEARTLEIAKKNAKLAEETAPTAEETSDTAEAAENQSDDTSSPNKNPEEKTSEVTLDAKESSEKSKEVTPEAKETSEKPEEVTELPKAETNSKEKKSIKEEPAKEEPSSDEPKSK